MELNNLVFTQKHGIEYTIMHDREDEYRIYAERNLTGTYGKWRKSEIIENFEKGNWKVKSDIVENFEIY